MYPLFRLSVLFICGQLLLSGCKRSEVIQVEKEPVAKVSASLPKVGEMAPNFSLQDSNGQIHQLSDFRGNFVFLNLWATWCPPCVQEIPLMEALNENLKSKAFSMIAVSVDSAWAEVNSFLAGLSRQPSFLILLDSKKQISELYGTTKFPETFVIDPKGRIVKKYIGAYNWMEPKILDEFERFFEKTE